MKAFIIVIFLSSFVTEVFAENRVVLSRNSRGTSNVPFLRPTAQAADDLIKRRCPDLDIASLSEESARAQNLTLNVKGAVRLDVYQSKNFASTPGMNGGNTDSYFRDCRGQVMTSPNATCAGHRFHHPLIIRNTGIGEVSCFFGKKKKPDEPYVTGFNGKNHSPLGYSGAQNPKETHVVFPDGQYDLTYSGFRKTDLGNGSGLNVTYEMTFDIHKVPDVRPELVPNADLRFKANSPPKYFTGIGDEVAPLDGKVANVTCHLTTNRGPKSQSQDGLYTEPSFKQLYAALLTVSNDLFGCPTNLPAASPEVLVTPAHR